MISVGCLVAAVGRLDSIFEFYSLWSEDPTSEGGSVCGRFEVSDVGIVLDIHFFEKQSIVTCARVYTSCGLTGWIACKNLRVVAELPTTP